MDMTNERLMHLIGCHKTVTRKPKKDFIERNGCRRNDFDARSDDGERFHIFLRQNTVLHEDFSVGLRWECLEASDDIIICRFNGLHGGNRNVPHHLVTHIHKLNVELAESGKFKESDAEETDMYSTFPEAIYSFCLHCGLRDALAYFPEAVSNPLF